MQKWDSLQRPEQWPREEQGGPSEERIAKILTFRQMGVYKRRRACIMLDG